MALSLQRMPALLSHIVLPTYSATGRLLFRSLDPLRGARVCPCVSCPRLHRTLRAQSSADLLLLLLLCPLSPLLDVSQFPDGQAGHEGCMESKHLQLPFLPLPLRPPLPQGVYSVLRQEISKVRALEYLDFLCTDQRHFREYFSGAHAELF
jgi:hypothetical protein